MCLLRLHCVFIEASLCAYLGFIVCLLRLHCVFIEASLCVY